MPIVEATDQNIKKAAQALLSGGLVAFPTETVYGLGADATNGNAVASIFSAKGRPRFNPLIVHIRDSGEAKKYADFPPMAAQLTDKFWPGPLTLVLQRNRDCPLSELVSAGGDTLALRCPKEPIAQKLLEVTGKPIAAPSANRSGHVSPTTATHVHNDLGDTVDIILDGGPCRLGLESTIIGVIADNAVLLRPGSLSRTDIEDVIQKKLMSPQNSDGKPTAPGQLESHYAPQARLRLNAKSTKPHEALLAFGPHTIKTDGPVYNLSPKGNLLEAAANLFAALRKLDETDAKTIAVMPIPEHGLGEAINDRLKRAAAPR